MRPDEHLWPAPAKINLMLRVVGQYDNGYHQLQTVFQFLDYGDELHFSLLRNGQIKNTTPLPGVDDTHNLALQAAHLLKRHENIKHGVSIDISKRLPMGGGLGGGSSNAATTLLVLNKLWAIEMPVRRLAELGQELGADVPIFIHGHSAWAEGTGEKLTHFEPDEPWYLVVDPGVHVSTAEIFRNSRLTRNANPIKIRDFLAGNTENTCQPLVTELYPKVKYALDWLDQYGEGRMTGTGGCVFVAFSDQEQANRARALLPDDLSGFVARGLNQSPVYRELKKFTGAWPSG